MASRAWHNLFWSQSFLKYRCYHPDDLCFLQGQMESNGLELNAQRPRRKLNLGRGREKPIFLLIGDEQDMFDRFELADFGEKR